MEHLRGIQFEVRTMRKEDFPQIWNIQHDTGWQWSVQNDCLWYEVDPKGWIVAVTPSGEILGMCSAVRHYEDFHFVGFYLVKNKYRGMGIGSQIWKACLEYIGPRNAGLNAVPEMEDKYQKNSGFSFKDDGCLLQEYETHDLVHPENLSSRLPEGVNLFNFDESHLPAMFAYDYKLSGYGRQLAVELNCKDKESKTLVAFEGGICVGYATMKIGALNIPYLGPMYADEANIAEAMLKELLLSFSLHKGFSMVTFVANEAANDFMRKIGCPKSGVLPRLYIKSELMKDFRDSMHKMFAQFDIYFSPF